MRERYGLVSRYYGLKRKLLGLDRLYEHDRYAPLPIKSAARYSFAQAVEIVEKTFRNFDPGFAEKFLKILNAGHADAPIREAKRAGAFCAFVGGGHLPYVLLNFSGAGRDVETLAHEMGHAVHDCFAATNPALVAHPPLTLAEIASIFGEMLVFENLLSAAKAKEDKIVLIAARIDGIIATIFRQIAIFFFERKTHDFVRQNGEIPAEKLGEFWLLAQKEMFGASVSISENYSDWWAYVNYCFDAPFYAYAYAFGNLLVFSLYEKYKESPRDFVRNYKRILSFGGTKTPAEALAIFGFDIERKEFWQGGLKIFEKLIEQLEYLC